MKNPVQLLAALSLLLAAALSIPLAAGPRADAPVVVELFTSQGCNSCPPADALLGELAGREGVIALGFHVTYWDRLGWPDTFGLEAGTQRQEAYAAWLGASRVYTPQMIIGGRIDVVGSQRGRVLRAIELVGAHAPPGPKMTVEDDVLRLGAGDQGTARVWLAAFDHAHDVAIERGENRGRTLRYHDVVRELREIGRWRGAPAAFELPLGDLAARDRDGAAVLLQRERDGAILAASKISLERRR